MQYMCSRDIYVSTTYYLSVYEIMYKTLGQTHTRIFIVAEKDEYYPRNKDVKL